jgi:hypothetical protein
VSVSGRVLVLPTATVPKPTLQGVKASWPADCASARLEKELRKSSDKSVKEMELHREEEVLLTVRPL